MSIVLRLVGLSLNKPLFFLFGIVNFFFFTNASPVSATVNTTHYIDFGGSLGFHYSPNTLTFEVGDTIIFRGDFVTYPLVSVAIPPGALPLGPVNSGTTYSYIVDMPGTYSYQNKVYASVGMKGNFTGIRLPHGSLTNEGREFYLGMLYPTFNNVAIGYEPAYYKVYALVTTYYSNTVNVSYFDAGGTELYPTSTKIPARGTLQFQLDLPSMRMDSFPEVPMFRTCHITSKYPISVQFLSVGANAGGSYLALPVQGLGKNYIVASYNDNAGNGALYAISPAFPKTYDIAGGTFMVIATEDNTAIKITPNSTTTGGHVGVHTGKGAKNKVIPFSIGLSRGQCYLVRSDGKDATQDISGSVVEATKPVAVIAGAEDATLGGVSGGYYDARDFMIEQMTPVEVWDTSGYFSIPFLEATPYATEGHGDNYRVYAFDTVGVNVQADVVGIGGGYPMNTTRLAAPASERFDITSPVDIYSTNGHKISVIQYDERSQPTGKPATAPSMATIVPHSRWRKAYNFSVLAPPTDHGATGNQYIDVIADSLPAIMVSANGAVEHPIITALPSVGYVNVVSKNYPNVRAARYRIGSGPYYFHSDFPFVVYSYGMNEFWYFYDDKGNYEVFESEYAAPTGMQLNTGITPTFNIAIDTLPNCMGWNICVRDTGKLDPGVRVVTLVDDSEGVYYGKIGAKFNNVTFDSASLDLSKGELIPHWHSSQPYCFTVKITNRLASASVPLSIIDNNGNGIFIRLSRSAPQFSLKTSPIAALRPDSIFFPQQTVGSKICTTFVFKNTGASGNTPIDFTSAKLQKNDGTFTINSITPPLPFGVVPQDSFKIELCFNAKDSLRHRDSLIVSTDCFDVPITLDAHSVTGLINADNLDFDSVTIGTESCKNLLIHNSGSAPFMLMKSWLISDSVNFSIDPQSLAILPMSILPGKSQSMKICFHPKAIGKDTARIDWATNINGTYSDGVKKFSILTGRGIPVVVVSVQQPEIFSQSFTIHPNPVSGTTVICFFSNPISAAANLSVFDVLGREIYKQELLPGVSKLDIPIRNLSEGMYYVKITSSSSSMMQSFVKVK